MRHMNKAIRELVATKRFPLASNRYATLQIDLDGECLACNSDGSVCVRTTTCGEFAVIRSVPMQNGRYKLIGTCHTERGYRSMLALYQ
jgi:hypothetical protein